MSWSSEPCPLFVPHPDDPFVCVYDDHPYEAHTAGALAGRLTRFDSDPDMARAVQRRCRHRAS